MSDFLYPFKYSLRELIYHPFLVAAVLLLLILLVKYRFRRTTLVLLWITLAGLLMVTSRPASQLYNIPLRQNTPDNAVVRADAIVVPGSGVAKSGVLTQASLERITRAVELYQKNLAPLLVVTGAASWPEDKPDGTALRMKAYAISAGVPKSTIVMVPGYTTREEAVNAWQQPSLQSQPVRHLLLVTHKRYLYRVAGAFRKVGFEVSPVALNESIVQCNGWFSWCYAKAFLATSYEYLAISRYRNQHWLADDN